MEHYCFDIIFPEKLIDFASPNEKDGSSKFHAHLYTKESSIELRIFFGFSILTAEFSLWLYNGKLEKAFAKCIATNINKENNTQQIDFSESKIIGHSIYGNQIENGLGEYFKITLSSVRIYLELSYHLQNSADFYMNSVGFDLVKDFHSLMSGNNGEFKIGRTKGCEEFYKFENIEFRPEFDFNYSDDRNDTKAIIEKKPKIRFTFPKESSEKEILRCAEIVRLLGSFYMHNNIEYNFTRIHLQNCTLLIYKSKGKEYQQSTMGLHGFGLIWDFHELMLSDWQNSALLNYKLLSKIIPLFVQSMLVDHHSSLLILCNIFEYCMGGFKTDNEKYPLFLSEEQTNEKHEAAFKLFLETIDSKYHKEFLDKWKFQLDKLKTRPEKSKWSEYIISKSIEVPQIISIDKIKKIRDNITHGSLDRVKETEIKKANALLYGISGILILQYLNIQQGNLDRIAKSLNNIE
jgi:hypothetical protein